MRAHDAKSTSQPGAAPSTASPQSPRATRPTAMLTCDSCDSRGYPGEAMARKIGILCGGGDAPGLNAVIRAVVKYGVGQRGWELWGFEDSFNGLLETPPRVRHLTPVSCRGILQQGGTVLGTTNKGDPFKDPRGNRSREVAEKVAERGIEGLITIGGDGSMRIARDLMDATGLKLVGVPKTIDNDLGATDLTFGFQSAVDCATDALDRLHSTAEAHDRVIVLEVMGRDAGWIALHAAISGGADVCVIPEIPWDAARVCAKITERARHGRPFSLVVVAEGATPAGSGRPGSAGQAVVDAIRDTLPEVDVRITVLGHLQRGGSPVAFDRLLATRFGVGAVDLVEAGRWGELVALRNGRIEGVSIRDAVASYRTVDPAGDLVRTARAVGIELGGGTE
jgi:phosphofructokinase-like protein